MPISNTAFQRLIERKDHRVSQLRGSDQVHPPQSDPVREALVAHDRAVGNAMAKAEANMPIGRGPVVPEPVRSWDNDYQVRVGDFEMPASLLFLVLFRDELGPALVAEIAKSTPGLAEAIQRHLGVTPV